VGFDRATWLAYHPFHFVGAWLSLVERSVRDREVGGSNPLAPTNRIKNLRLPTLAAVFRVWPTTSQKLSDVEPSNDDGWLLKLIVSGSLRLIKDVVDSKSSQTRRYRPLNRINAHRDSLNVGWRNASFRGYADYMQTAEFEQSLEEMIELTSQDRIALMCAEAVPWRCYGSLIADALLIRGIRTEDIMSPTRRQVHTLTPFAKVRGTTITYPGEDLQNAPRGPQPNGRVPSIKAT
jgi:hypothetical protein